MKYDIGSLSMVMIQQKNAFINISQIWTKKGSKAQFLKYKIKLYLDDIDNFSQNFVT